MRLQAGDLGRNGYKSCFANLVEMSKCAIEGCGRTDIVGHQWCNKHYCYWYRTGIIPHSQWRPLQVGDTYGRLTLLAYEYTDSKKGKYFRWQCSCGNVKVARGSDVRKGSIQSCGCLHRDTARISMQNINAQKPPHTHPNTHHPLYRTWIGMRQRCNDSNSGGYHCYGGRGITVCAQWDNFAQFIKDMGEKPGPEYTLDRIDNDGPYDPQNCRWATRSQQALNRRPKAS